MDKLSLLPTTWTVSVSLCSDLLQTWFMKILIWFFLQEWQKIRACLIGPLWSGFIVDAESPCGASRIPGWVQQWRDVGQLQSGNVQMCGQREVEASLVLSALHCLPRCMLFLSLGCIEWSIGDSLLLKIHQIFRSYYFYAHDVAHVCEAHTEFKLHLQLIQTEWLPHLYLKHKKDFFFQ